MAFAGGAKVASLFFAMAGNPSAAWHLSEQSETHRRISRRAKLSPMFAATGNTSGVSWEALAVCD